MSTVFHVRWSSIKTFRTCPKKYQYAWIQKLQSRKPPAPLIRGTMIGRCLDQLADKKKFEPILQEYETEYGKLFKSEQEEYGDIIGEVRRIVQNYKELYKNDGLSYVKGKDKKPYEIEVESSFKIDERTIRFTGHIDKLAMDEEGRLLIMDHKSHKAIPDANARYNDLQLLTYVWLLPLSGYANPDGVLWDYLRTKPPTVPEVLKNGSLTKRQNLDSDYQTYLKAIEENNLDPEDYKDVLDRFKAEGGNRYFERVKLPSPQREMIDNIVTDFKVTVINILDSEKTGQYVRNMTRDCNRCEFYNLCQAELRGLDTDFIRKQSYKEREIG